jgi:hypothetical protein
MTELSLADGSIRRSAVLARADGQRMAALPCALVARALSQDASLAVGVHTAYDYLGAAPLVEGLVAEGFELHSSAGAASG